MASSPPSAPAQRGESPGESPERAGPRGAHSTAPPGLAGPGKQCEGPSWAGSTGGALCAGSQAAPGAAGCILQDNGHGPCEGTLGVWGLCLKL